NQALALNRTKILYFKEFESIGSAYSCFKKVKEKIPNSKTIVQGYSFGGHQALKFSNLITKKGMKIDLGITVDPVSQSTAIIDKNLLGGLMGSDIFCPCSGSPDYDQLSPPDLYSPKGVRWLNFWQEDD